MNINLIRTRVGLGLNIQRQKNNIINDFPKNISFNNSSVLQIVLKQ